VSGSKGSDSSLPFHYGDGVQPPPHRTWHWSAAGLAALGLATNLVANLATNTVQVPWRWWPAAVWTVLVVLTLLALRLAGRPTADDDTGTGAARPVAIARGHRSVAIGGDNRGTVVTGDGNDTSGRSGR
jgi:peptidoglycan/LPS O-acetylase OafA/YrhL